jgi:DNA-directed RNA polymerase specialized sigma24 family protein
MLMDTQEVLNFIDELVFAKTGKHLDTLQVAILKGVLNNRKYAQIAEDYHCSQGHVRDASYELWQLLSTALGADINKSNFRATVERGRIVNFSNSGNPVQIEHINFCTNPAQESESLSSERSESDNKSNNNDVKEYPNYQKLLEEAECKAKLEAVPKLAKLGLRVEQIAESLELPLAAVHRVIQNGK